MLDIATIVAAPMCASLLAEHGADVVKLEIPGRGDGARDFPPFKEEKSLWWKSINRNKNFITLDLRTEQGVNVFKRMIPLFDVLIENFRPGTLDRWGVTREVLWDTNPNLTILRVSAFGQDGPYKQRPGFARVFEAMGGLTYLTGEPGGEPMHSAYPIGDAIGGLFGAVGVLAALYHRLRFPESPGQEIDLSLTEGVFRVMDFLPLEYDQLGVIRERTGNASQYSAPAGVFMSSDCKYVSLVGSTNSLFRANARAIGREELADDARYASNSGRHQHAAELNKLFSSWIAEHTLDEVMAAFEREGGTIAPIYAIDQIFDDPQMQARGAIVPVPDQDFSQLRMQRPVPRFSATTGSLQSAGGTLGEHNREFYIGRLGLTEGEFTELLRSSVI